MRFIDRYLRYSTIFALFTEAFQFQYVIQWKLFYLILSINFFLLLRFRKVYWNKLFYYAFSFFIIHGIIMFLLLWNPITSLISQLLGIALSSIYFYSFFKNYGVKHVFSIYINFAFIIALVAIPMFFFKINLFDPTRLNGILSEPAHYAAIMLPATYFLLREKNYFKFLVLLITIVLSQSLIGFIGLLMILVLPLVKKENLIKYTVVACAIFAILGVYIKNNWDSDLSNEEDHRYILRLRHTQESLSAIIDGKFDQFTNLSSYAILSNAYVSRKNFLEHPFGTGLGSYRHQYDIYSEKIQPPQSLSETLVKINREDANSLLLRMIADFGIFGVLMVFYFLIKSVRLFISNKDKERQSTFFYVVVKLMREGHYFPPEFYFFLLIFLKDFDEDTTYTGRLFNK